MGDTLVSNVSDTARWVATYRAIESARADALFKDPYAERLAGARGRAIAGVAKKHMGDGWPIVVRTKLIDDLVAKCLGEGCDQVLNLAAGLDTRPYRLDFLKKDLSWVEADLPPLLDEKDKLLAREEAKCTLSRERVDLADPKARREFLDRVTAGKKNVLVSTEGLLVYLDEATVRELSEDFAARSCVRWWMFDLASPAILGMMRKDMGRHLDNAPVQFGPPNGVAFFEALGWKVLDADSQLHSAARLKRLPWFLSVLARLFPPPNPRELGQHARWSATVRLARAKT